MAVTLSGADAARQKSGVRPKKSCRLRRVGLAARTLIYFSRFEILIDTAIEFSFFIIAKGLKGVRLLN